MGFLNTNGITLLCSLIKNKFNSYYTKTEVDTELNAKQDTLTFDTTPTTGSTNPVTSGGIKTVLDSLDVTDLSTKFNNSVDLQGVKNILPYPYYGPITPVSSGGITWTDNGDGTITASGVATALSMFYVIFKQTTDLYKDECYISGVPASAPHGCTISYRIGIQEGDIYYSGTDVQPGQEKSTVAFDGSTYWLHVYLRIAAGTDCTTPVTFKPMIRRKDTGGTNIWTPYTMTNQELTNLYIIEDITATSDSTIAGNSSKDINISTIKEGYEAVGVLGVLSFSSSLFLVEYVAKGTYVHLNIRNTTSSALTGKMSVIVLFKKNI